MTRLSDFLETGVVVPDNLFSAEDWKSAHAKMVIYYDSISCTPCAISHLWEWNEIVKTSEQSDGKFATQFIFFPQIEYRDSLVQPVKKLPLDWPIVFDSLGEFRKQNISFPIDSRFHTFLLDKNGKVVLVGDPVNNPKLWELYKTTITQLIENDDVMPIAEK